MIELVVGTTNPAKVRHCELALGHDFRLVPLTEVLPQPPPVDEDALAAEENAARKAQTYAHATGRPVLSLDFALFFAGVPDDEQPGVNVRRIPRSTMRPSDDDLLRHYAALFARLGGRAEGWWEAGAAVAAPGGSLEATTVRVPRTFVAEPSPVRVAGYPLASLQLTDDGRYWAELGEGEEEALVQAVLHEPLRRLAERALDSVQQPPYA